MSSSIALNTSQAATAELQAASSNFGLLARVLLGTVKVIPGVLYWIITFTTITLPTWIFTLASMSLTVTMNATTL